MSLARSRPSLPLPRWLLSTSPRPPRRPPPPPPMATSSGRLALHGHVSTTDAPLTQGGVVVVVGDGYVAFSI